MLEVPANGGREPIFEAFRWFPLQVSPRFGRIHRITPVVAGPIRDEAD